MLKPIVATLVTALAVTAAGVAQVPPSPISTPVPLVTPMPPPTPMPIVTPSPSASPSAKPSTSPAPVVTPIPLPTPLVLPPDAPPQILAIRMSDPVLHSGELVSGTVITSTNVASVEVHLGPQTMSVPRTDIGIFELSYRMPHVPFFMRRTYTAAVIAHNAAGVSVERDVKVSIQ